MAEPTSKSGYKGTSRETYRAGGGNGRTEGGYSNTMKKNILGAEASIRTNRDESAHVFDEKGRKLLVVQGKKNRVDLTGANIPPDSIITHNHPLSIGRKGIMSIGNSFSSADVATAVAFNAKEMRAVTPTYTFSIKRPKGGWGDPSKINAAYKRISKQVERENTAYINKTSSYRAGYTRAERATVTHTHSVMSRLAKQFGWDYTKKKG